MLNFAIHGQFGFFCLVDIQDVAQTLRYIRAGVPRIEGIKKFKIRHRWEVLPTNLLQLLLVIVKLAKLIMAKGSILRNFQVSHDAYLTYHTLGLRWRKLSPFLEVLSLTGSSFV